MSVFMRLMAQLLACWVEGAGAPNNVLSKENCVFMMGVLLVDYFTCSKANLI